MALFVCVLPIVNVMHPLPLVAVFSTRVRHFSFDGFSVLFHDAERTSTNGTYDGNSIRDHVHMKLAYKYRYKIYYTTPLGPIYG